MSGIREKLNQTRDKINGLGDNYRNRKDDSSSSDRWKLSSDLLKGSSGTASTASTRTARPLSSLPDPRSWAPPPRHHSLGGANPNPPPRGHAAPAQREQPTRQVPPREAAQPASTQSPPAAAARSGPPPLPPQPRQTYAHAPPPQHEPEPEYAPEPEAYAAADVYEAPVHASPRGADSPPASHSAGGPSADDIANQLQSMRARREPPPPARSRQSSTARPTQRSVQGARSHRYGDSGDDEDDEDGNLGSDSDDDTRQHSRVKPRAAPPPRTPRRDDSDEEVDFRKSLRSRRPAEDSPRAPPRPPATQRTPPSTRSRAAMPSLEDAEQLEPDFVREIARRGGRKVGVCENPSAEENGAAADAASELANVIASKKRPPPKPSRATKPSLASKVTAAPPPPPAPRAPYNRQPMPQPPHQAPSRHAPARAAASGSDLDLELGTEWYAAPPNRLKLPASLSGAYTAKTAYAMGRSELELAVRQVDLSVLRVKLSWPDDAVDRVEVVTLHRGAPPREMTGAELVSANRRYGNAVAQWAEGQLGQKVGDGECWTLAAQAIEQGTAGRAMRSQQYVHGALVFAQEADRVEASSDAIRRGDILQLSSARFGAGMRTGEHHTAVITHVSDNICEVVEQNMNGRRAVARGQYDLYDLQSGRIEIYRVVDKDWLEPL